MQIEKREPTLLVFCAEPLSSRLAKLTSGVLWFALGSASLALVAAGLIVRMDSGSIPSLLVEAVYFVVGIACIVKGLAEAINIVPFQREVTCDPPCSWRRWGRWRIGQRTCVRPDAVVVSTRSGFKDWRHFVIEVRNGKDRRVFFRSDGSWRESSELRSVASTVAHEVASLLGCPVEIDEPT